MDIFEAIEKRHSYRFGYKDQAVPREDLVRIVQAGIQAPSGCNAQTTSFVIVDEPELIAKINVVMNKRVIGEAKAIIVCVASHPDVYHGMSFGVEDCAAAVGRGVECVRTHVCECARFFVGVHGGMKLFTKT